MKGARKTWPKGLPKKPTSAEILSKVPKKESEHGSGNPHLQPGELRKAWSGKKSGS
jgi:hypothetical protein